VRGTDREIEICAAVKYETAKPAFSILTTDKRMMEGDNKNFTTR
jgi:hypothetical protein